MAKCLFKAVPEVINSSAVVGLKTTVIIKMLASEGLASGTFRIQNLESWIKISLGPNLAKVGLEQELTVTLDAQGQKVGKLKATLKVG